MDYSYVIKSLEVCIKSLMDIVDHLKINDPGYTEWVNKNNKK